jgi:ribosomal protein L35
VELYQDQRLGKIISQVKKASKSIRNLRKGTLVSSADEKRISKIIPYK